MCVWGWGLGAYETLGHFWVGCAELHLVCCSILEKKNWIFRSFQKKGVKNVNKRVILEWNYFPVIFSYYPVCLSDLSRAMIIA